jgi:hypothetical protein
MITIPLEFGYCIRRPVFLSIVSPVQSYPRIYRSSA